MFLLFLEIPIVGEGYRTIAGIFPLNVYYTCLVAIGLNNGRSTTIESVFFYQISSSPELLVGTAGMGRVPTEGVGVEGIEVVDGVEVVPGDVVA